MIHNLVNIMEPLAWMLLLIGCVLCFNLIFWRSAIKDIRRRSYRFLDLFYIKTESQPVVEKNDEDDEYIRFRKMALQRQQELKQQKSGDE